MDIEKKCPGYYCGRMPIGNDSFSDCGACDRGWKRNSEFICVKCDEKLELYDLLFLAFNIVVPLLIHLFLIDFTTKTPKKYVNELLILITKVIVHFFKQIFQRDILAVSLIDSGNVPFSYSGCTFN